METPKQKGTVLTGKESSACFGIIPPKDRNYSSAEEAAVQRRVKAEVRTEFAERLRTAKGLRLWWLKLKLNSEIKRRVHEYLYEGV